MIFQKTSLEVFFYGWIFGIELRRRSLGMMNWELVYGRRVAPPQY